MAIPLQQLQFSSLFPVFDSLCSPTVTSAMTTNNELWLTYHQVSCCNKPATVQLIELEFQNHRVLDLEDVLEHFFPPGFIEAKHRSSLLGKSRGSASQQWILGRGNFGELCWKVSSSGHCYYYLHKSAAPVVTQRVRLDVSETKFDIVAQLTNHINSGYLPRHMRSKVSCGRKVEEHEILQALLETDEGICETTCLRLNIDQAPCDCSGKCPFAH